MDPPPGGPGPPDPAAAEWIFPARQGQVCDVLCCRREWGHRCLHGHAQVPWGLEAVNGTISHPAWRTKPSWYLLTTEDRMIPPDAQRAMSKRAGSTVVEVKASHAVYVSQPRAVVTIVEQAAKAIPAMTSR